VAPGASARGSRRGLLPRRPRPSRNGVVSRDPGFRRRRTRSEGCPPGISRCSLLPWFSRILRRSCARWWPR
jgi:hypothetical protein